MILISTLIFVALLAALTLVVRRVISTAGPLPLHPEWITELSIERYRPLMRLLDESELDILCSQAGFTPGIGARVRAERIRVFRGHLRCLTNDFRRVCMAVKVLMLQSPKDRPDLATALLRAQATFVAGLIVVEARLFFYRWGICGVDASTLVGIFDVMRLELKTLVPVGMGAAA